MLVELRDLPADRTFDVVVVGAGGAGLSAALFAAIEGASVLVVERTDRLGGTTAYSAGTTWIPCTHHAASVSEGDTIETAERYLANAIGDRTPAAMRRAFLDAGARAVAHLEANSDVRYRAVPLHPDYISELEGSTLRGRALEPLPFDGRELGALFDLIRPPIREFTVLDGMMVDRNDIRHLLGMMKSLESFRYCAGILARHALDRLRHPRGTRLVMGNALVARLVHSLSKRANVAVAMDTSATKLTRNGDAIESVTLSQGGQHRTVRVRGGVVLASGGFNRHAAHRAALLPGIDARWCPGAPGHTGEAQSLALSVGARFGRDAMSHAFWAPVSMRKRPDGTTAVFPHFVMDRAKPGMITVNRHGRRFVNESTSYHLFGLAMQQANADGSAIPAFLVADAKAFRTYGMGMARPGGRGIAPLLADGYLTRGDSLRDLAGSLGIDADGLEQTVARFNGFAAKGVDDDFGRGTTAYQRNLGDASAGHANPSLGPLTEAPFYAVRLYPGDIGAATGLVTDTSARVLDADDRPIGGLYAVGNDMHSIMGGVYTAPGITLGPGLVFAFLAAKDVVQRANDAATAPGNAEPAFAR